MNFEIAFGIIVVFLLVSLIILFCGLLIKLYIHKVKKYTSLIYQKDIDFQKILNTTIIETQEQVLKNISQDLHDDAGQQLTFINFQLEHLKLDVPELATTLLPISESVSQLSNSIRGISHSLNNQLLLHHDLLLTIESELERMKKTKALQINYTCNNIEKKVFSSQEQIVVYRIFQEMMNNILKHAKATHVDIAIEIAPFFKMTVTDDGKGFDRNSNSKNTLGLISMVDRASLIGYNLEIISNIGEGTTLILTEKRTA
ncbi:histidine kinase [Flavobacterium sp.]|uniref:sensor histidine kinase n=1 Tax=Flavobacterium sp. TaxID=239 RepID=UPI00286A0C62|nr:histidine kinase [Flavobacterium sp.]